MQDSQEHFVKIFYLLAGCLLIAFGYVVAITFIPLPKENVRFADTTQGFMLGTVIAGVLGFFIGASVQPGKQKSSAVPGTTTAEVNISASTETKPEDET